MGKSSELVEQLVGGGGGGGCGVIATWFLSLLFFPFPKERRKKRG